MPSRRRLLLGGMLVPLTATQGPVARAAGAFRIGVAPHTSARVIVEMYQPLRLHLEGALQRPVEIVTSSDFTEFARRAMAQAYDLAITTGHQARLLQTDAGYLPLLTYLADFRAVALVAADSHYAAPRDLAGTTVFGLSESSLVTLWGLHWLQRNAVPRVNVRFVSAADSTAYLVLRGEGSCAFHSLANYRSLPAGVQAQLRILDQSLPMAGRVYMLNGRHKPLQERLLAGLWAFAGTSEAQHYFARYSLEGYRALEPRELVAMEPYANEVRQVLRRDAVAVPAGRAGNGR